MVIFITSAILMIFFGVCFIGGAMLEDTIFFTEEDYAEMAKAISDAEFEDSQTYDIEVDIRGEIIDIVIFYKCSCVVTKATYDTPPDVYYSDIHYYIDSVYSLDHRTDFKMDMLIEAARQQGLKLETL